MFRKRAARRQLTRSGLIAANVMLLGVVAAVVLLNPSRTGTTPGPVASAAGSLATVQPIDQLASVNIAVTVTQMTNLPERGAVTSQADSERIQLAIASTNSEVVNKPQAVSSAFLSKKDIHTYITQPGDTVSSIASKFSISTDSVMWSNSLLSTNLAAGQKLYLPPVNGIVYTVKAGDTPSSLASKFRSSEAKIIAYNDAELTGLHVGDQIIIPDGQVIIAAPTGYSYGLGFAWGSSAIYGYNGYDWGNCTWYVATQIAVPANWGNASTWAAGARAAGWHVSSVPSVGAIAQNSWMAGGLGHVAIVKGVSSDGKQVLINEMNGEAGFDAIDTVWQPTSSYPNYITR